MKVLKGIYSGCKRPNVRCFIRSRVRRPQGVNPAYCCEQSSFCVCLCQRVNSKARQNTEQYETQFYLNVYANSEPWDREMETVEYTTLLRNGEGFWTRNLVLQNIYFRTQRNEKAMPCRCTHFLTQTTAGSWWEFIPSGKNDQSECGEERQEDSQQIFYDKPCKIASF